MRISFRSASVLLTSALLLAACSSGGDDPETPNAGASSCSRWT